ncbi:Rap1 GTPase-activating protein 2 [Entomortierella beljakovae]|nr:Rap1 GTPase-activating protein 2 [Entomortierella beljakovae]
MAVPPGISSANPISGSNTLYKDTMNTFSTIQQDSFPNNNITPNTDTTTTTTQDIPSTISSSIPTDPLENCLSTLSNNNTDTVILVHNQTSNSAENNCINMPNNLNISASDGASADGSRQSNDTTTTTSFTSQSVSPADAINLDSNNVSSTQTLKSKTGSKSFGFFGALSPKNSKQKLTKPNKKESRSSSPSTAAVLTLDSPSPPISENFFRPEYSGHIFSENNFADQLAVSHSGVKESKGSSQERKSSDGKHSHLGQRLSKAIGLSQSSLSKDQQQFDRRESVDSLSTIDAINNQPDEHNRYREGSSQDKEKKNGLVSQFFRHRVVSSSDVSLPRSNSPSQAIKESEEKRQTGNPSSQQNKSATQGNQLAIPPQFTTIDNSSTSSDISTQSGHREGHESRNSKGEKSWLTIPSRYGFGNGNGSNGGGKSIMSPAFFKHRRGSLQIHTQQEMYNSHSVADMLESSREVHPHHTPNDFERQDLCNHLGLQEVHRRTGSESPAASESPSSHMYSILARRRGSLTPGLSTHLLSQNNNLSASNSSIDSSASATSPVTGTKPSSRLARLTRFKFPTINVGNMHKNKSATGIGSTGNIREPIPNNIRRGSLPALMISSQLEPLMKITPRSQVSGPASTFTPHSTAGYGLTGSTPESFTPRGSVSSNHQGEGVNTNVSTSDSKEQTLTEFLENSSKTSQPSTAPTASNTNHQLSLGKFDINSHDTPPPQHRTTKVNFGSERFTSSTSGSHERGQGQQKVQGQGQGQGQGSSGGKSSGIFKRTSRRTVSASYISSDSIFSAYESGNVGESESTKKTENDQRPVVKHVQSECDMKSTNEREPGSVGQYLFGNELKNMTFGEEETKSKSSTTKTSTKNPNIDGESSGEGSSTSNVNSIPLKPKKSSSSIKHLNEVSSNSSSTGEISSQGKPILSSASINQRTDRRGGLSQYTFPPTSIPAGQSTQGSKSKYSMIGSSYNSSQSSSVLPGRHSFSHNSSGAANVASALNLATSTTGKSSAKPNAYSSPRTSLTKNPNAPHLEPRSAVSDYKPLSYYKRQRSMSLQDADLLTADQFIALMSDDTPTKRRFSSEEPGPENNWYTPPKIKRAPQPDPSTVLRSLLSELRSKCELALKHLDTIYAPVSTSSEDANEPDVESDNTIPSPAIATASISKDTAATSTEPLAPQTITLALSPNISSNQPSQTIPDSFNYNKSVGAVKPENHSKAAGNVEVINAGLVDIKAMNDNINPGQDTEHGDDNDGDDDDEEEEEEIIEFNDESLDIVSTLFDEMDHTIVRMNDVLTKYISIDQFSKLSNELDDMCYLAQTVIRSELEKRKKQEEQEGEQYVLQAGINSQSQTDSTGNSTSLLTEQSSSTTINSTAGIVNKSATQTIPGSTLENQIKDRTSMDKVSDSLGHDYLQHQNRQYSSSQTSDDSDIYSKMTPEEQHRVVINYIQSLLSAADTCVAEYMKVYNRMFVVPAPGYRIEGCNDMKKIERSLKAETPHTPSNPKSVSNSEGASPSLLSRASAIQITAENTNTESKESDKLTSDAQPESSILSNANTSSSSINLGGQPMARVKSLPESNEWAALQKRKEMGGSPGVAGALSMGSPAAVGISSGNGGTSASSNLMTGTDMMTLGDYSNEHMGHEAYYYRNWFLGKEHRTYVGQVEGLGTVIISIIKDMVVPIESRPSIPVRSNTGPLHSMASTSTTSVLSTLSQPAGNFTAPSSPVRPELVHSSYSFYPGRGANIHSSGGSGAGMIAAPRASTEAMRIIHAASTTTIASGSSTSGFSSTSASNSQNSSTTNSSSALSSYQHNPPNTGHGNNSNNSPRWQYRCILRQKDVDSVRITLPEPESGPLNNLTRRVGKPQWKNILQSIHPAISQQVASKLKKVQTNPQFEKELAKFDETMLRFNYKFGVLLVLPGQTKEEDWFSNQMSSSPRFQEFLDSGALGQKVTLKGFERFSAGLDTRSDNGDYSYFDTWGQGFEIMYHVSTLLPFNTGDRQQIQRKRHIGNDIVCIVFVDGDHPFVPNTIKSQFLHIFVVVHPIVLPDGTRGYSAAIACDEQVPGFGPPLPDPSIFRSPHELRAFLLCKMINGENAAYKAPRLIKPHQRARSGMLENLVSKANTLTKEKDSDKKNSKQQKPTGTAASIISSSSQASSVMSSGQPPIPHSSVSALTAALGSSQGYNGNQPHYICPYCTPETCCGTSSPQFPQAPMNYESQQHPHSLNTKKSMPQTPGPRTGTRTSLVSLGSETAASLFRAHRRNSNSDVSKIDSGFNYGSGTREKERYDVQGSGGGGLRHDGPEHIENLVSPAPLSESPSSATAAQTFSSGPDNSQFDSHQYGGQYQYQDSFCGCCGYYPPANCAACFSYSNPVPSPYADYKFPPAKTSSTATPDKSSKSGSTYPHSNNNILPQRARSEVSTPTELQFPVNSNVSHPERPHGRHSLGSNEPKSAASMENKESGNALGMSINNKGKSKSEIDLLLKTTQENSTNIAIPKRSTTDSITPNIGPSNHGYYQARHSFEIQQHHTGSTGLIAMPHGVSNPSSNVALPSQSSMKGRAHYFLTTLVRRRASSNDTSALGPTVHYGSKTSNLSPANPPGSWSSGPNGAQVQTRTGVCPYHQQFQQHHVHGCQIHHQRHHHHYHHQASNHTIRPRLDSDSSPHPHQQVASLEQPLKFKEGYNFRSKAPMQINTAIASPLVGPHNLSSRQQAPPSASTTSSASSNSIYACSSLTSASFRSSAGATSSNSFGSNPMLPTPASVNGVSPQSLRSFPSRDGLNRTSFSTDRRASVDLHASRRVPYSTPVSWGSQQSGRDDMAVGIPTTSSYYIINSSTETSEKTGPPRSQSETGDQRAWRFSESPLAYTPSSIRQMDSMSSFGSASTPASVSTSGNASSISVSRTTDYLNFKPITIPRNVNNGNTENVPDFRPGSPAAGPNTARYTPIEYLSLRESHSLMAINNGPNVFPSTSTFASIPSSISASTTVVVDIDSPNPENTSDFYDEALMVDPVVNKVVKRAASVESFLKRDGVLVRMASLQSKGTGLQESIAISRNTVNMNPPLPHSKIDKSHRRIPQPTTSVTSEASVASDSDLSSSDQPRSSDENSIGSHDQPTETTPAIQTRTEPRLRKISESQNSHCSLEVEQLDVKFEVVIN